MSSYCAAKHGVDGFIESLRAELAHDRIPISVTQVLPGAISTPFFENARSRLGVRPSGPPPVYRPQKVVDAILAACERPRREHIVGTAAKVQLALQRVSPRLVDVLTTGPAFRLQRSTEAKNAGDDALFDAPHGEDRVEGTVRTFSR
jgi:short-subunit dehydrogenase